MAENIVAGLFGLTPEMYGEQQRRSALREGIDLAKLTPGEAGAAMTYAGARGLGGAIAGAMGIEDPQLKLISARNSIFQQIDQSNPESMMQGIKMLSQAGDQQGAMALADYYRKAQSESALAQQRMAERMTPEQRNALAFAGSVAEKGTPQFNQVYQQTLSQLINKEKPELTSAEMKNAKAIALLDGPEGSPAYNAKYASELQRLTTKAEKDLRFGVDREAIAGEMFDNKSFSQLTATEKAAVNKRVETEKPRTTITNVMPGDKQLRDIPAFRASVQRTIEPQSKAVFAADNALVNIQDSIDTDNFTSFRAAKTQFARAISGSGDLSQKELLAAGADPALIGGTADYLAELFTSTPTLDTQNKMKKTLLAIKKVSTDKANSEIETQRKIAYSNPGYDKARVDQALAFPEFSGKNIAIPDTGDYAAQARALLKQRQEAKK
jgi:hypothetical protein